MVNKVDWLTDLNEGLSLAKTQGKTVLLDFYNPQ
jgi:hypothetical protein